MTTRHGPGPERSAQHGTALDARGEALVDAVYESLGDESNASGGWRPGATPGARRARRLR